ncbi:MAG: TetR/AcrR family transcriptional regulator [Tetrasphaera sp.]
MATSGPRRGTRGGDARSAATRAALLTAGHAALREVGYAAASAREIAGRAQVPQSQVFYHYGSVAGLLLAVLDEVSARRMTACESLIAGEPDLEKLVEGVEQVVRTDLAAGDVAVLVEMICGTRSSPELAAAVAERLEPWHAFARDGVRRAVRTHPLGALVPVDDAAHALVAGILGIELLALLEGSHERADALIDRAVGVATLVGMLGAPAAVASAGSEES